MDEEARQALDLGLPLDGHADVTESVVDESRMPLLALRSARKGVFVVLEGMRVVDKRPNVAEEVAVGSE